MDVYKQVEAIFYYPNKTRWSTLNIVYGESTLHNVKDIEMHKPMVASGGHLSLNRNSNHSL